MINHSFLWWNKVDFRFELVRCWEAHPINSILLTTNASNEILISSWQPCCYREFFSRAICFLTIFSEHLFMGNCLFGCCSTLILILTAFFLSLTEQIRFATYHLSCFQTTVSHFCFSKTLSLTLITPASRHVPLDYFDVILPKSCSKQAFLYCS